MELMLHQCPPPPFPRPLFPLFHLQPSCLLLPALHLQHQLLLHRCHPALSLMLSSCHLHQFPSSASPLLPQPSLPPPPPRRLHPHLHHPLSHPHTSASSDMHPHPLRLPRP